MRQFKQFFSAVGDFITMSHWSHHRSRLFVLMREHLWNYWHIMSWFCGVLLLRQDWKLKHVANSTSPAKICLYQDKSTATNSKCCMLNSTQKMEVILRRITKFMLNTKLTSWAFDIAMLDIVELLRDTWSRPQIIQEGSCDIIQHGTYFIFLSTGMIPMEGIHSTSMIK